MMKYTFAVLILTTLAAAQYRGLEPRSPSVTDGVLKESATNALFGLFDPEKFSMSHGFSMSYTNVAGQNIGLTMYTNTMRYQLIPELSMRADVSVLFSPFSSLGAGFQKEISGIYLSRAELNYQPWKDVRFSLSYRYIPGYGGYGSPYSRYGSAGQFLFWDDGY